LYKIKTEQKNRVYGSDVSNPEHLIGSEGFLTNLGETTIRESLKVCEELYPSVIG
jgi:hypothetical protein